MLLADLLHELVVVFDDLASLVVDEVFLILDVGLHLPLVVLVLELFVRGKGYSKVVAADVDVGGWFVGVDVDRLVDRLADSLEVQLQLFDDVLGVGLYFDLLLEVVDAVELFYAFGAPHPQFLHEHVTLLGFFCHLMHLLFFLGQVLQF